MRLHINGEAHEYPGNLSLIQLWESLGLNAAKVAVEVNLAIIPRSRYAETMLADGDKIEIVQFMGGG